IGAYANYPWYGPGNVTVVNQGTISADTSGGTITIAGTSLNNAGTLEAENSGVIQPTSTTTINSGEIVINNGTTTFANGFTQLAGKLDFGLNSPSDFGKIAFSGSATLGGTLAGHLNAGYQPNIGDSFAVLNYGSNNLSFTNLSLPLSNDWQTNAANGVLTLEVENVLPYGVAVSPTNSIAAVGTTLTLYASATGPGPLGFQWFHNGSDIVGATNATLVLTNLSKSASGAYTITVSDTGGSLPSAPVQVQILALPVVVTPPPSQTASVGSAIEFGVAVSGDQPLAYQWLFNGANIPGMTNSSLSFNDVTRQQAGNYKVMVSNPVGIVTSAPPAVLTVVTGSICPSAPSGMIAWWTGNGDTSDYAGTNDAVWEGTGAYAPGEVGEAFSFDGVSSYLQVPNSPLWNFGTNDFSFEFWANFATTNSSFAAGDGSVGFLAHDEETGTHDKWVFGFGGGEIYLFINGSGIGAHFLVQAPFNPQTNQWYHLALTRGGAALQIYIDGAQVFEETNSLAIPAANAPLTIGQADGFFMQGLMDEISIYDRALTSAEIAGIYSAGALGKCPSSQPLTIEPGGFNSNGQFQFQILGGQAGAAIQVQASSNLANWTNIWQITNANSVESFTDTNAVKTGRFYRAIGQ
ncbi:MAG TPA: LamG-like jellyroll fold domain-containing protein, partial [Verrucomicrobiae bacterium]